MTTAPPDPLAQPGRPITSLPPLPNPLHPRGPSAVLNANDALRTLQQLGEGANSGSVEYPYPTTFEYPLPPLPPIPAPSSGSRRRRSTTHSAVHPVLVPPIPASSPLSHAQTLDEAIAAHNATQPDLIASLQYARTALLVKMGSRGYIWAFLRTLDADEEADAHEAKVLCVRFFPSKEPRPPPIHAVPPTGPATVLSEHLTSLDLSVPALLYRLPHVLGLLDSACFYCSRHLSDVDGLPFNATGFIPVAKPKVAKVVDADKDGDNKDAAAVAPVNGHRDSLVPPEASEGVEGRWVSWHAGCETA